MSVLVTCGFNHFSCLALVTVLDVFRGLGKNTLGFQTVWSLGQTFLSVLDVVELLSLRCFFLQLCV